VANALLSNAKHIEISRRYAWHARQRRDGSKLTRGQLIPRVRLRGLERIFQHRYGRFLPDDDAGRDDLVLAAHHVAHLEGDARGHILAWARAWAPWMPQGDALEIAERVAAGPQKFTADGLAWRLRLSMAERTALRITTIGAFDVSKADRAEERRRKKNEAKRIRRAQNSTGRPRGRPRKTGTKNAGTAVDAYAVPAFSDQAHAAPEAPKNKSHDDGLDNRACARLISTSDMTVKRYKSRIPASLRPTKSQLTSAMECGFDLPAVARIFEHFRDHHLAIGSYAADWNEMWESWVSKRIEIEYEEDRKARAREYRLNPRHLK
jgi:hypothetical protein